MGENAPPPDGWVCEPHAWNAVACCPPTCLTPAGEPVLGSQEGLLRALFGESHIIRVSQADYDWLMADDHITRGDN